MFKYNFCIYITLLILISQNSYNTQSQTDCLEMEPYCNCTRTRLTCENFDYFVELNFTPLSHRTFSIALIYPRKPNNLLSKQTLNLHETNTSGYVSVSHVNAFDASSNPFEHLTTPNMVFSELAIKNSKLVFVNDHGQINKCDQNYLHSEKSILCRFKRISIYNSTFDNVLCPFLFQNCDLSKFWISDMSKSTSQLEFEQLSENKGAFLNANISDFRILDSQIVTLDARILEKYTFRCLQKFTITNSYLEAIDERVFVSFDSLTEVEIGLYNMNAFMRNNSSSTKWLASLKLNSNDTDKQLLVTFNDQSSSILLYYGYPESDFCKFLAFPHEKNVLFATKTNYAYRYECTCTLLWLLKNFELYADSALINNTYVTHCLGASFRDALEACEFERRVCECEGSCPITMLTEANNKLIVILIGTVLPIFLLLVFIFTCWNLRRMRQEKGEDQGWTIEWYKTNDKVRLVKKGDGKFGRCIYFEKRDNVLIIIY